MIGLTRENQNKIYKRNYFSFLIVNLSFFDDKIPSAPLYGDNILQLLRLVANLENCEIFYNISKFNNCMELIVWYQIMLSGEGG